jgi:hypothetical protein
MKRRQFLSAVAKTTVGSMGLVGLLTQSGCSKKYINYEEHPVDQVFRDYNGYRTLFTDKENVVRERKYCNYEQAKRPRNVPQEIRKKFLYFENDFSSEVFVIKDLEGEKRGFASVIYYNSFGGSSRTYAEIHIPKSQKISPGIDVTGGKSSQDVQIYEID